MSPAVDDLELRAATDSFIVRQIMARAMGQTYEGKRDLGAVLGYKDALTVADYRLRYERGGIAETIVDAPAKATWRGGVELIEDDNEDVHTPLELLWDGLEARLHVTAKLQALDILSRLSTFAVLLIGAPGEVTQELPRGNGTPDAVMFLKAYCGSGESLTASRTFADALAGVAQADAIIDSFETNPADPRFGQPKGYRLRNTNLDDPTLANRVFHPSRIVHAAEDCLDDEFFGKPALRAVWNYLDDLEKVIGGGAEAFFQRANQGRMWGLDKDVTLSNEERTDFREQIEKFQHNIIRDVRMRGVKAETLGSDVANFANQADALLKVIAGTARIPMRLLVGSEMGELASSQDRDNFREQINGRREQHAGPYLLKRLVDRLIDYNYLPKPKQYQPRWGSVLNLTEEEKRQKMQGMATTNQALKASGQPVAFLTNEIRAVDERAPYTLEDIEAERELLPEPVAAPVAQFPRAATESDEALVDRLAAAIEAEDTAAIEEALDFRTAYSPDQLRDENGRWVDTEVSVQETVFPNSTHYSVFGKQSKARLFTTRKKEILDKWLKKNKWIPDGE